MINFSDMRIRPKLISLLIFFGLIPMLAAAIFSSRLASNALIEKSFQELNAIQSLRSSTIEGFFNERLSNTQILANEENIIETTNLFRQQKKREQFTEEEKVNRVFFENFIKDYGYSDLIILDARAPKVLFSLHDKAYMGKTLTANQNIDHALLTAWNDTIDTQQARFTDFEASSANDQGYVAYFSSPILDAQNNLIGVVALKVSPNLIAKIVDSRIGMGETGESYLIGINKHTGQFELRSNIVTMGAGQYTVGFRFKQELDYWRDAKKADDFGGQNTYIDSAGRRVLVVFNKVKIPGYDWYLISKVNENEITTSIVVIFKTMLGAAILLVLLVIFIALKFSRSVTEPLIEGMSFAQDIAKGRLDASLALNRKDEIGDLADALNAMAKQLRDLDWVKSGKENLDDQLRGDLDLQELANRFITFFSKHMGAQLGAFYLFDEQAKVLELKSSYAFTDRQGNFNRIQLGEGIVGQAALEQQSLIYNDITQDAPLLNYGAGEQIPKCFMAIPLSVDGHLLGAVLLGSMEHFSVLQRKFVSEVITNAAVLFNAATSRQVIESLLQQSQLQQENLR
ncbi:MAG: GAF domain-containing protein, partial [Psychromonas sp.]|nr:GAF domain-containing protein [Psychromonas sp.]